MIDEAYYEDASQTETNTLTGRAGPAQANHDDDIVIGSS
jgi:hypothetical protein